MTVSLDASNRIVLSRELRRAAGISRGQKLLASATPGRIVLEMELNSSGGIVQRGKLKVWTGEVPAAPIEEAVTQSRHYRRCRFSKVASCAAIALGDGEAAADAEGFGGYF